MEAALSDRLRENSCAVHVVARTAAVPMIAERVVEHARDGRVAIAPRDPLVDDLGLLAELRRAGLSLLPAGDERWRRDLPLASVGVTGAALAVLEPAAIGLACGPGVPRATSLVPPVHVCVLRAVDIVPTLADAIHALASTSLPSALTWIGGPSRTGDLEMVQTLGVHGPIVMEVVIIGA
jgi:L-lactate utilization protein LutC